MFKASIEKQGLDSLKKLLKESGGWPALEGEDWKDENLNWKNIIQKHREVGLIVFYFMKFKIVKDIKNTNISIIQVIILYLKWIKNAVN